MRKVLLVLIIMGVSSQLFGQVQEENLNEVEVLGLHFKYLDAMDQSDVATSVKNIHKKVGNFDIHESELYDYQLENTCYTFEIPEGQVLATFDRNGNLLTTVEKFKNTKLPYSVGRALAVEYPGWSFDKIYYTINYHYETGIEKKYKLIISKEGKTKRVILNPHGDFL